MGQVSSAALALKRLPARKAIATSVRYSKATGFPSPFLRTSQHQRAALISCSSKSVVWHEGDACGFQLWDAKEFGNRLGVPAGLTGGCGPRPGVCQPGRCCTSEAGTPSEVQTVVGCSASSAPGPTLSDVVSAAARPFVCCCPAKLAAVARFRIGLLLSVPSPLEIRMMCSTPAGFDGD